MSDQKQKQLLLKFEDSCERLHTAVKDFGEAAKTLVEHSGKTEKQVEDDVKAIREQIRRMIGCVSDQTGMDFHTVWVLAYHEHFKRTGFHAVAASKGKGAHLDQVELAGQLPALQETVTEMLTRYPARAV